MPETTYSYNTATETANGRVEPGALFDEIVATPTLIIAPTRIDTFGGTNVGGVVTGGTMDVVMKDAITKSTLDAIVLAHTGDPIVDSGDVLNVTVTDDSVKTITGDFDYARTGTQGILRLPRGTSFPTPPQLDEVFFRTDTNTPYRYDGSTWQQWNASINPAAVDHNALQNLTVGNPHTQYQLISEKGAASGYASLDANSFLIEAAKSLRETSGPTTLDMAGIADGTYFQRSGSTIVGATPPFTPLTNTAPVTVQRNTAQVGVSTDAARADHRHDISVAAPSTVGTSNTEGTSSSLARADHVHDHGAQTEPTHHAVASGAANGFMASADKTKLDGITAGAEPNQTITAGAGLTGGGSGSSVTIDVAAGDGSIVVGANDITVGVVSDVQHGNRGGGGLHAAATTSVAGFLSAADKTKLDGIESGAAADQIAAEVPYTNTTSELAATDVQAALDELAFPRLEASTFSMGISTTTSTTFQNKLSIAALSLPAGTYKILVSYGWNHDATNNDFEARITLNAAQLGELHKQEPKDAAGGGPTGTTQRYYVTRSYWAVTGAGTYTVNLDYRTDSGGVTSAIWEASMEIWRYA